MCHLRGLLMLKLNRGETAKECFMEALALDVKCYDAFDQLVSGEMMTTDEGEDFSRFDTRLARRLKYRQNGNLSKDSRTKNKHPKMQTS